MAVDFGNDHAVFPLNKVEKQFAYGRDDSIFGMFEMIGRLFKREYKAADAPRKPKWKLWRR